MPEAIRMPLLSDTMTEGKIVAWHKKVGDQVASDEAIADVETDKATMEVMPYVDGTLLYVGIEEGGMAKVNQIIAIVGKEGESYQDLLDKGDKQSAGTPEAKEAEKTTDTPPPPDVKADAAVASQPAADKAEQPAAAPAVPNGDATVITMPLLSDTMTEGKIVVWHKKAGELVKADEAIADVETDKATMEVMPYVDGTLLYIGVKEGDNAAVNAIIAIVGKAGTDVEPYLVQKSTTPAANEPATAAQPAEQSSPKDTAAEAQPVAATLAEPAQSLDAHEGRIFASPLAKKMAQDKGIDLHEVHGTGDLGRVVKKDIENYKPAPKEVPAAKSADAKPTPATPAPAFVPAAGEHYTDTPASQIRKIIAQKLTESKNTSPHFYLTISLVMDEAIKARKAMNEVSSHKISFNDLIIKCCAMALRKHPEVNSSWIGENIRQYQHIHIGTAVAIDEGLIVPVVKFADQKSLAQIAEEASVLIEKARVKKLIPSEFSGNTFTISNLGMMDIDEFTAIINPPDAAILAIGKIAPTPVVENDAVVIRQIMKLTLSCDHRVVDGAVGARFLQTLKGMIENPVTMLV